MPTEHRNWMKHPHILARVKLIGKSTGGRSGPLLGAFFSCPMLSKDRAFDARLILDDVPFELGSERECGIVFLNWETAKESFPVGQEFKLMQSREIGAGKVLRVFR